MFLCCAWAFPVWKHLSALQASAVQSKLPKCASETLCSISSCSASEKGLMSHETLAVFGCNHARIDLLLQTLHLADGKTEDLLRRNRHAPSALPGAGESALGALHK